MYYTHAYNFRHEKSPHRSVQQNRCGDFYTSACSLQQSSLLLFPSSPLGETERGSLLLILILPPILFRHFQKFSKLLHPVRFHLPSIHHLPIGLHPVEHIVLLYPMLRRISMIRLNKTHHLIIPHHPSLFLCHTIILLCSVCCDIIATQPPFPAYQRRAYRPQEYKSYTIFYLLLAVSIQASGNVSLYLSPSNTPLSPVFVLCPAIP